MLLRLTERCRVPIRLDSVAGGVRTGHKISAVYFVGRCTTGGAADATIKARASREYDVSAAAPGTGAGGQLKLRNVEAAAPLAEGLGDDGNISGGSPVVATHQEGDNKDDDGLKTVDDSSTSGTSPRSGPETTGAPRQGVVLEPTADRLVLFQSECVSTETLEVAGRGQEQYAVLFWMHGAKEEEEEEVGEATGGGA